MALPSPLAGKTRAFSGCRACEADGAASPLGELQSSAQLSSLNKGPSQNQNPKRAESQHGSRPRMIRACTKTFSDHLEIGVLVVSMP